MKHPNEKRFEEFFVEGKYIALKNHLYNYQVRRRAINAILAGDNPRLILEVGSGLSPIVTDTDHIVYSELSFTALKTLRAQNKRGHYVVADGTCLPFANDSISHVVCSEVLEHVEDDRTAIRELARVVEPGGRVYITVPHREFYYAADDRFVRHFRRYEIPDMQQKLVEAGLHVRAMKKVLGPLEKVTMFTTVMFFSGLQRLLGGGKGGPTPSPFLLRFAQVFKWCNVAYAWLARLDATIMPRALATVMLFEAVKDRPAEAAK